MTRSHVASRRINQHLKSSPAAQCFFHQICQSSPTLLGTIIKADGSVHDVSHMAVVDFKMVGPTDAS
jgi:hypothetical protein